MLTQLYCLVEGGVKIKTPPIPCLRGRIAALGQLPSSWPTLKGPKVGGNLALNQLSVQASLHLRDALCNRHTHTYTHTRRLRFSDEHKGDRCPHPSDSLWGVSAPLSYTPLEIPAGNLKPYIPLFGHAEVMRWWYAGKMEVLTVRYIAFTAGK